MARGWESKSVESQIDAAQSSRPAGPERHLTPEQAAREREAGVLRLARSRVLQQLQSTTNPRYARLLEDELRSIDAKLAKTGDR
jgi:hypothetical protein